MAQLDLAVELFNDGILETIQAEEGRLLEAALAIESFTPLAGISLPLEDLLGQKRKGTRNL